MLQNAYTFNDSQKIGFDTAENEPSNILAILCISLEKLICQISKKNISCGEEVPRSAADAKASATDRADGP